MLISGDAQRLKNQKAIVKENHPEIGGPDLFAKVNLQLGKKGGANALMVSHAGGNFHWRPQ